MIYLFSFWIVLVGLGCLFSYIIHHIFKKEFKFNSIITSVIILLNLIAFIWFVYNTFGYTHIVGLENVY